MPDLEHALRELGRELAFPPAPELAGAVGERLRAEPPRRPLVRTARGRPLTLAFAVVALALAAALAVPDARTAILELLGIRGATVERVPAAPEASGRDPVLGERVTLAEARRRAAFPVRVPAEPHGGPQAVHLRLPPPGGMVSLVYHAKGEGPLFVLSQFRGSAIPLVGKLVGPETEAREVDVDGARGVWISGAPHVAFYRDDHGNVREQTRRLAGNVLLWEVDGITYRLEGELSEAEAFRVARSLRDP